MATACDSGADATPSPEPSLSATPVMSPPPTPTEAPPEPTEPPQALAVTGSADFELGDEVRGTSVVSVPDLMSRLARADPAQASTIADIDATREQPPMLVHASTDTVWLITGTEDSAALIAESLP